MMDVTTALKTRKSVRSYTQRPLARNIIRDILDAARHAPSGVNMQPWEVAVVTGASRGIGRAMALRFDRFRR